MQASFQFQNFQSDSLRSAKVSGMERPDIFTLHTNQIGLNAQKKKKRFSVDSDFQREKDLA